MNPRASLDCSSSPDPALAAANGAVAGRTWGPYWELSKPRLSFLSVLTALVGYTLSVSRWDWIVFLSLFLGTSLAAASAAALNQFLERERDARMQRTRGRPLPQNQLSPTGAVWFGLITGLLGVGLLAVLVNPMAALVALATILLYVAIYTPMKPRTVWNTEVGAVAGALPPLIGVAAAGPLVQWQAWYLLAVLFAWQMPHFLAISWIYREDYARGGYAMRVTRPHAEPAVGRLMVIYSLLLTFVTTLPAILGHTSWVYGSGALVAGLVMTGLSFSFVRQATPAVAWKLFFYSLIYLPAVLGLAVVDRWFFL